MSWSSQLPAMLRVLQRAALVPEARLLDDADRPDVARDDRGLHAIAARRGRRRTRRSGARADVAWPRPPGRGRHPVAERRVAPRAPDDVPQRDTSDDRVAGFAVEHGERVAGAQLPRLDVAPQRLDLPGARVVQLGVDRLPRAGVRPVGDDDGGRTRSRPARSTGGSRSAPRRGGSSGDVTEHARERSTRAPRRPCRVYAKRWSATRAITDQPTTSAARWASAPPMPPESLSAASVASSAARNGNRAETTRIAS